MRAELERRPITSLIRLCIARSNGLSDVPPVRHRKTPRPGRPDAHVPSRVQRSPGSEHARRRTHRSSATDVSICGVLNTIATVADRRLRRQATGGPPEPGRSASGTGRGRSWSIALIAAIATRSSRPASAAALVPPRCDGRHRPVPVEAASVDRVHQTIARVLQAIDAATYAAASSPELWPTTAP